MKPTDGPAGDRLDPVPSTLLRRNLAPGLMLTMSIAAVAAWLSATTPAQWLGLSILASAIVLGIIVGNILPRDAGICAPGIDFAKTVLLRLGIILYGFRISFQEVAALGWPAILISVIMVAATFLLALQIGTRVLKLDRGTAMLIGAGSAICGAAAVVAAAPVIKGPPHKVSVAVATVVTFGTLGMFLYPALYPHLGLSEQAYGMYVGSTVHEVAQVVAAGGAVSMHAGATATVVKMVRVMMLVPFLLLLSRHLGARQRRTDGVHVPVTVPWFALLFLAATGANSIMPLPETTAAGLAQLDTALLATAMAALGVRTKIGTIVQAGVRPMLLAGALFLFLVLGGYAVNIMVNLLFESG